MGIPTEIRISKYKKSRFHTIWVNEELLAVVCYKKGALAIKQALLNALNAEVKYQPYCIPVHLI
ncbi:MAG: hypothetical protein COB30_016295 [Ectothiorhodospiraceae bacterium]|nr:hypothetical protein [Ectothiorhodospiraceae bacterium]